MAKFRVTVDKAAVAKILRDKGVADDLRRRGENIAKTAGDGFDVDVWQGRDRVRATVRATTPAARRAEARERRLSRSLRAGKT